MKTLNDIRRQVIPALQRVEKFRLEKLDTIAREKRWYGVPIILLIAAVIVGLEGTAFIGIALGVVAIIVLVLVYIVRVEPHRMAYISNFKEQVFASFIKELYPSIYYAPSNYLPSTLFSKSELFGSYDDYTGEDYFEGQTDNGCTFKFSELYVTETTRSSDSDTTTTIFDGMFFVLDVPNRVNGRIQILPDSSESTFGRIGKFMQKKLGAFFQGAAMVYMEDHPEFEKEFVVYSKDEAEAYRILTPGLLNAIYDLRYRWDIRLSVSFIGHQIYVAFPSSKNFFHPNIDRSVLEDNLIEEIYHELGLCFAVVEDLSMEHKPSDSWEQLNVVKKNNSNTGNSRNNPFLL